MTYTLLYTPKSPHSVERTNGFFLTALVTVYHAERPGGLGARKAIGGTLDPHIRRNIARCAHGNRPPASLSLKRDV